MTIRFFSVAFTLILFAFMWTVSEFDTAHAAAPRFEDYPAQVYSGRVRSPDLASHPDARTYRTRLRKAAKGGVNFAGDHVLVTWGCGGQCLMGAVINARSGHVQFLPGTICCWLEAGEDVNPIDFDVDSDLLVLTGLINENEPMARHYYDFSGRQFRLIESRAIASGGPQAVPPTCPAGYVFSGGKCVRQQASPKPTCPAGYVFSGGKCVRQQAAPKPTCPAGYVVSGGKCAPYRPPAADPEIVEFTILDGYDLFGGDYKSMPGQVHYDDCEYECKTDRRCKAFTYNTKHFRCFLKSSVPRRKRFRDARSGIKK